MSSQSGTEVAFLRGLSAYHPRSVLQGPIFVLNAVPGQVYLVYVHSVTISLTFERHTSVKAWFWLLQDQDGWCGGGADCSGLECLLLGFGMRPPGTYIRVLTAYILTKNSRLGFARAWEGAGVVGEGGPGPWDR